MLWESIVEIKFLGDAGRDDGLSQSDDIGEEEAAVLLELEPAVIYGVSLVAERFDALR